MAYSVFGLDMHLHNANVYFNQAITVTCMCRIRPEYYVYRALNISSPKLYQVLLPWGVKDAHVCVKRLAFTMAAGVI